MLIATKFTNTETVPRRCSVKKLFLKISTITRKANLDVPTKMN